MKTISEREVVRAIIEENRKTANGPAAYNVYKWSVGGEEYTGCEDFDKDFRIQDAAKHIIKLAKENPNKKVILWKDYRFPDGTWPMGQRTEIATIMLCGNGLNGSWIWHVWKDEQK